MNKSSVNSDGSTPPASTAAAAAGNNSNAGIGGRTRHLPDVSSSDTSLACPAPPKRSRPNDTSSATATPVPGINNIPTSTSAGVATLQPYYPPANHAWTPFDGGPITGGAVVPQFDVSCIESAIGTIFAELSKQEPAPLPMTEDQPAATVIVYAPECQPRICVADLDRRCTLLTAGRSCPDYHSVHGFPYQWQWTVDDPGSAAATASVWRDFGRNVNIDIERSFCDISTSACTIYLNGNDAEARLDFDAMTLSCDYGSSSPDAVAGRIRRLETEQWGDHPYATVWQWYWWSNDDEWNPYESSALLGGDPDDAGGGLLTTGFAFSEDIERSYLEDPFGTDVWCDVGGTPYVVDFAHMTQTNVDLGTVRKIRRRPAWLLQQSRECSKSDAIAIRYPDSWDPTAAGNESSSFRFVAVKNVGATEDEFNAVSSLFASSLPNTALKSIQRIQNRSLWKKFYMFKTSADAGRQWPIDVRQLFHGTKRQYIDAICSKGFDWRLSGMTSGTRFGKGSYFARDASYSSVFTDCQMMFVVAVGEFAVGSQDIIQPPPKDASRPYDELYDSCVDNLQDPEIFVTFDRDQAYPEYLIEY